MDVDLIFEIHRKLTPMNAVALADALVEFRPLFYEDPIQIDSITLQARIAMRTVLPVANGERMSTVWEFRDLLEAGGPQYVRPDLGIAGGLTGCRKIAALAESYHSALVSHNFLGPLLTAASIQLDVAIPNFITQEYLQARRVAAGPDAVFKSVAQARGRLHPRAGGAGHRRRARRRAARPGALRLPASERHRCGSTDRRRWPSDGTATARR